MSKEISNPIKIQYRDVFRFAPFSIMVDPERVCSLMLNEIQTDFPENVAYLFGKQMEEADTIVLNKIDLMTGKESERLLAAIGDRYPGKKLLAVSATEGTGMAEWLEDLISGRPGGHLRITTVMQSIKIGKWKKRNLRVLASKTGVNVDSVSHRMAATGKRSKP